MSSVTTTPVASERIRARRVAWRNARQAGGLTTQHYHRNERLKSAAFAILTTGAALGGVLSLLG